MESTLQPPRHDREDQIRILTKLTDAEIFEQFLHTNYVGAKRFSLEGARELHPAARPPDRHLRRPRCEGDRHRDGPPRPPQRAGEHPGKKLARDLRGLRGRQPRRQHRPRRREVPPRLLHRPHHARRQRGPPHALLQPEPPRVRQPGGRGPNPRQAGSRERHGARGACCRCSSTATPPSSGRAIVAETLNLCGLEGYSTGGTVHVVVNNQIGFTTMPRDARSTRYCTDITRMLRCPGLPRERRGPGGGGAGGPARCRVPPALPARTSSSTSTATASTATTRATSRASRSR